MTGLIVDRQTPPITLDEIVSSTQAEVVGLLGADVAFRWIERNSREIVPGDLFIAVSGERLDGHAFVADAAAMEPLPRSFPARGLNARMPLPLYPS